ncbi:MAG: PLD nuclease N-terminal domain-containing protein, partial [Pseudomonadota bacterium]
VDADAVRRLPLVTAMIEYVEYLGLWLLLALTLNMWAWLGVLGAHVSLSAKVVWTVPLVALPGIGFVLWYLFGPRWTS